MLTRISLRSHWQDWASLLIGIWLFASPWMFQYTDATLAAQNAWVVGILLFCVAVLSRFAFHLAEEYVDFFLALLACADHVAEVVVREAGLDAVAGIVGERQ